MKMKLFIHFLFLNLLFCVDSKFLPAQNAARARVGVGPLVWSSKVARYAQRYANERKADCALKHSQGGPYGENIFWGGGSSWKDLDADIAWISENTTFNYKTHRCDSIEDCGHYSQIVWRKSIRAGCARVVCDNGDTFITCNYDPPGNYIGEAAY